MTAVTEKPQQLNDDVDWHGSEGHGGEPYRSPWLNDPNENDAQCYVRHQFKPSSLLAGRLTEQRIEIKPLADRDCPQRLDGKYKLRDE